MGKTQSGAVWIDPEKTSPYDFFQYWRNIADADVIRCMKMLTFIPLDEIKQYEGCEGSEMNSVKERLAYEITAMVHGKEEAEKALATARGLFSGGGDLANMPSTEIELTDDTDILSVLVAAGLCASRGEGRRLIEQGGISVNDVKVTDVYKKITDNDFSDGSFIVKKGKKVYHRVIKK